MGLHDKVILRDSSKVAQNPSGMQHKIWPTRDCNRQRKGKHLKVMADTPFVILPKLLACRWRGVFHFEAYIENMNDFCQIDTVILTDDQKQKNQKTRV